MKTLVLAALLTSVAFAQNQERTFYYTQPVANVNAMVTAIRTVVDIQDLTTDASHHAMIARAPLDKLTLTEWIFHQLDQPESTITTPPAVAPEYRMSGDAHELVRIFRLPAASTNGELTAMVTAMRTVADVQRLFPYEAQQAIVARGPADKVAAIDWLIHQLYPATAENATEDSSAYPINLGPHNEDTVIRVLRARTRSNAALTAMTTAIRTIVDVQRIFPMESAQSLIVSGPPEKVAVAQWLVDELRNPSTGTPQTQLAGTPDNVVGVFYVHHHTGTDELAALVKQLREATQIQRLFPLAQPGAVVLRGRPDQIPLVEAMVAKFGADVQ